MGSELRKDMVSGDWILISPGRGKRPHQFKAQKRRKRVSRRKCIFEHPEKAGGGEILLSYPEGNDWQIQVVPNKYPAVITKGSWIVNDDWHGPFEVLPGFGHHELVITRDHNKNFSQLGDDGAYAVMQVFKERYRFFEKDSNLSYVSMFHNWGENAGASIYHPHYQILSIPVIPPDVEHSIRGSAKYFAENKKCVHCVQIEWELSRKDRIIFENDCAVAYVPFVSKEPFEIRVFPKSHQPFFEDTDEKTMRCMASALSESLRLLENALNGPDYNFFIHTSPLKEKRKHKHYHWHIEIIPRTNISAGFELGTSIEINPLDPDEAAKYLKAEDK